VKKELNATPAPRHRKSARVSLQAEVQLRRSGQHHYMVNAFDISPEGCQLEFVERPRLDEIVWVKFDGYDAIESTVCWIRGHSVGIEFARPIYPSVFEMMVARLQR
jgi:hypothetical protein